MSVSVCGENLVVTQVALQNIFRATLSKTVNKTNKSQENAGENIVFGRVGMVKIFNIKADAEACSRKLG